MNFNELTLSNFRCFREAQRAHLAPLTLLVGENSTGKTSFLALIRVLWDVAFRDSVPDFKEPPYDLGSFDEIAHHRGGRGGRATEFDAGLSIASARNPGHKRRGSSSASRFHFTFRKDGSAPFPSVRRIESDCGSRWAEITITSGEVSIRFGTPHGQWKLKNSRRQAIEWGLLGAHWDTRQRQLPPVTYWLRRFPLGVNRDLQEFEGTGATTDPPTKSDVQSILRLDRSFRSRLPRPFSSAPVRSRPHRTYDPSHSIQDAEGEYIPMFLARVARRDQRAWDSLRTSLERFGQDAGLFDEIAIKTLGGKIGGPFQVLVRRFGSPAKGPRRNIIDVGYGVSQVLPVVTELLRPKGPHTFLLQQPEVHLHPSAQAALGSLFCTSASSRRQLIVETHSDHLIDRVRMDIRDGKTKLRPEDVSILYFQRRNLAVTIHSLRWNADGNLVAKRGDIPDGYRQFFRVERRRSLGL